jgi:hypothetical protein
MEARVLQNGQERFWATGNNGGTDCGKGSLTQDVPAQFRTWSHILPGGGGCKAHCWDQYSSPPIQYCEEDPGN